MKKFYFLRRLLADAKNAHIYLLVGFLLYFPVTILNVIQPLLIGYAVQHGMLKVDQSMVTFAQVFFLIIVLLAIGEYLLAWSLQIAGQTIVNSLRQKAFNKVQRLSMGFLDSTPMGQILTRLTNDMEAVLEMFSLGAVQIFGDVLFLFATFLMLFLVDMRLSIYSALCLPILAFGIFCFRLWMKKAYINLREVLAGLNSFLQEYLSAIPTVQISGRVSHLEKDINNINQRYLAANRQAIFFDAAVYSFVDAVSYLSSALVLWGAFRLKLDNVLALGTLVAFIEALSRFFQPVRELSSRYTIFQSALVSLDRIYKIFDWPEEADLNKPTSHSFWDKIEFKNLNFSYENGERVLKDVSFVVKKGQRVALIGRTGAGKSTVIKLLNRFYQVERSKILIDGNDINDLPLGDLRTLISVVPQEVFLFRGTLEDNLRIGNVHATEAQLWDALRRTQLVDTVQEKGGLKTLIEFKGSNFSTGERALLAIARTLVANPPILIFDEATSNVDAATELKLKKATQELLKGRTALIIAHRLNTIIDADEILLFRNGEILEQGNHKQLMDLNGRYANLIRMQKLLLKDAHGPQPVMPIAERIL